MKRHFDEICEDERLQDPESLFKVNIFYRVLDIIINQLSRVSLEWMKFFQILVSCNLPLCKI